MILVFGKTGQVASALQAFRNVQALGRDQAELCDPQSCADAVRFYSPKAVINAAAYTAVDKAESEADLAHMINGEAPGVMAKTCAEMSIPLVHISTDYVFDGSGIKPWQVSDAPNPQNIYGKSKLQGERAIEASGCVYAILRTSWVVSAQGSNFVKTMLHLAETRDSLHVVEDQIGGPTCARDIADACISIAKQLIKAPTKMGLYHYSGQPDISWCQFANEIFEQTGRQITVTPISTSDYPTAALRPSNSRLNCAAIQDVFGIPRPYWRDGLEHILEELESEHGKA